MKHPLITPMPFLTDGKIRGRLFVVWLKKHWRIAAPLGLAVAVPAMAAALLLVQPTPPDAPSRERLSAAELAALEADIKAAQRAEAARASSSIYHVTRRIEEGSDKPAFVAATTGEAVTAPPRTDVVETWQHRDTALALIESNGRPYDFEAYLSREHDGTLNLHHFGDAKDEVPTTREPYDEAHDLAALYTNFTSRQRPELPLLPSDAVLESVDRAAGYARFSTKRDGLRIEYRISLASQQVTEEVIYVLTADRTYEMTRVTYLERTILPADRFEEIFRTDRFAFEPIS